MGTWRISSANIFRSTWATHPSRDENHLPLSGTRCVREAWFGDAGATALKSRCVRGSAIKRAAPADVRTRGSGCRRGASAAVMMSFRAGTDWLVAPWHPPAVRESVAQDVSSLSRLAGSFAIDLRWAWSILMAAPLEDNQRGEQI